MHGWIILDKPPGLGSTSAVSAVKRALRQGGHARAKVGHGGTLDPLATGVLPIAIGEATKLAGRMLDASKVYEFTTRFGIGTDTLDAEGKVVATSDVLLKQAAIEAMLPRFTGAIDQRPPDYSALKVGGARAYDLARAGKAFELATRRVTVHELAITAVDSTCVTLLAHVSKGTYIRSLARDIAAALGTVGHVTMLRRTRAGPFDIAHAISLDNLDECARRQGIGALLRPIEAGLDGIPALPLTPDQATALRQGRILFGQAVRDGLHFATLDAVPVALVEARSGAIRVTRGFRI